MTQERPEMADLSEAAIRRRLHVGVMERGQNLLRRGYFALSAAEVRYDLQEMLAFIQDAQRKTTPYNSERQAYHDLSAYLGFKSYTPGERVLFPILEKKLPTPFLKATALLLGKYAEKGRDKERLLSELLDCRQFDVATTFLVHYPEASTLLTGDQAAKNLAVMAEDLPCLTQAMKALRPIQANQEWLGFPTKLPTLAAKDLSVAAHHNLQAVGLRVRGKKAPALTVS